MRRFGFNSVTHSLLHLRLRPRALLCVFLSPLFFQVSFSAVITVGPSGDYQKIQDAIDAATHGDEIIVSPGTYTEALAVVANFDGKNIILRSTDPTNESVVATTILDGENFWPVVYLDGTETDSCVLSGFTIRNGRAPSFSGGGILGSGTLATIQYNRIIGNSAISGTSTQGGGLLECDGTIQYNTISNNYAEHFGGGLAHCQGTIQYNTVSNNSTGEGGAFYRCHGTIQYNTILNNSVSYSGAAFYQCDGIIQHNTISGSQGTALSWCHGTIQHNTISGNSSTALYACDGVLQYNIVSNNSSAYNGGGVKSCSGLIQHNTISGNFAEDFGGGLADCHGTIRANSIFNNSSFGAVYGRGGAIYNCNGIIQNNTLWRNSANIGGAFYSCEGTIQNNTVWGNTALSHGGGFGYCSASITNCIIWQNAAPSGSQLDSTCYTTPTYSCIQGWTGPGVGNITSDPQLFDPANGDFHLWLSSPCVDAGCFISGLNQDFDGEYRPHDSVSDPRGDGSDFDIGADEYYNYAAAVNRRLWLSYP